MAVPLRHPGSLMTLDEWIALPEDNSCRYEPSSRTCVAATTNSESTFDPQHRLPAAFTELARVI